jgi:hypothetical protein
MTTGEDGEVRAFELSPEEEDIATSAFLKQLGLLGGVPMMDREEARYRFRVALVAAFGAVRRAKAQGRHP